MKKTIVATLVMSSLVVSALSLTAGAANDKKVMKDEQGKVHTVNGKLGKVSGSTAEERGLNALDKVRGDFGIDKARGQFAVKTSHKDELGTAHSKFQQTLNGLKVFGHEMIVHEQAGDVLGVTGDFAKATANATQALLDNSQAIGKALAHTGHSDAQLSRPATSELGYAIDGDRAVLAYEVNVAYAGQDAPANWFIHVNALDGSIIDSVNALADATGTGTGVFGDTKQINTTLRSGTYYLEDKTKPMTGMIQTKQMGTDYVLFFTTKDMTDTDNVWNTTAQRAGVDAHYYAGKVYDYYYNELGRNSYDNAGHSMLSVVHYGNKYNNAYWDGTQMVYGDGDGTTFSTFSGGYDVVAHELTHAVTEKTSNLQYKDQSGALNESWSDAMASVMDGDDWLIGEDIYTPGTPGDALRSMSDPAAYGDPDHMSKFVVTTSDNGGVHTNSGIPNKAFYNFATAIGSRSIAGKVWYTASRDYMTTTTNFSGARAATLQAAAALYGASSSYYTALQTAWSDVGVN